MSTQPTTPAHIDRLDRAQAIGREEARRASELHQNGHRPGVSTGHPGDDVGRLAAASYRQLGAAAAAEVVAAYFCEYQAHAPLAVAITWPEVVGMTGHALPVDMNTGTSVTDAEADQIIAAMQAMTPCP